MKNFNRNSLRAVLSIASVAILLTATSCSSEISISANKDCSTDFEFSADIGNAVYSTIQAVTAGLNEINNAASAEQNTTSKDMPLFSSAQIEKAFSTSDVKNLKVQTPTVSSITVSGTALAPDEQTSVIEKDNMKIANFITCTKNSLTLIVALSTVQNLVASLPEEPKSYLDLLMAPVLTGEEMSEDDYISLIGAVYGEKMQKEFSDASVKITLVPPEGCSLKKSALSDTKNVKTSSNKAVFTISLVEFLTLSSAKTFSIAW